MKAALPLAVSVMALAACVPAAPAPAPASPEPIIRPAPARPAPPPATPAPISDRWMDAPATPGDWRYADQSDGGMAFFTAPGGEPVFTIECDRETGPGVMLWRAGEGRGERVAIIRTETATKAIQLSSSAHGQQAWLAPRDPLLDAMALSKGRFAVEVEGLPPLTLPSWAEVTRVIEDCR